jgi:succinate dehydrogenase / fumarate reductase iron-sulfur subunit
LKPRDPDHYIVQVLKTSTRSKRSIETLDLAARRRFLGGIIAAVQTAIGGTLGVVMGGAVLSPSLARRESSWLQAGRLTELPINQPTPVMLRLERQDGYQQVIDRRAVFLVRTADGVHALDSTCTHLGCRVSWNAEAQQLECPCHGGAYDRTGKVMGGPPPAPLAMFPTRVSGDGNVLVQL